MKAGPPAEAIAIVADVAVGEVLAAAREATAAMVAATPAVVDAEDVRGSSQFSAMKGCSDAALSFLESLKSSALYFAVSEGQNDNRLKTNSGICRTAVMTYRQTFGV